MARSRIHVLVTAALTLAGLVSMAGIAQAHRTGESYLYFNVTDEELSGRFEITLEHLGKLVPLDRDEDGTISKAEFEAAQNEVFAEIAPRLKLYTPEGEHGVTINKVDYLDLDFDTFVQLRFDVPTLRPTPEEIELDYRILFDGPDPMHRVYVLIDSNTRTGLVENESQHSLVLGPGKERQLLSLVGAPWPTVLYNFIVHGIWHILIGYDHVLFIIALLLPSVLLARREAEITDSSVQMGSAAALRSTGPISWDAFKPAFMYVVKVVTLFTVAHTITLTLSALGIIRLPSTPVEVLIAFSIAVVAFNNIVPILAGQSWLLVFGFGLFHGLGFANVLAPLGVDQNSRLTALAGFNIGVELGQLLIIAIVFPMLFMLRNQDFYRPVILKGGSVLLIAIAMFWFSERFLHGLTRIGILG